VAEEVGGEPGALCPRGRRYFGHLGVGLGQAHKGDIDVKHIVDPLGRGGELVEVQATAVAARFLPCLRRALSTRMWRRLAGLDDFGLDMPK
jgi:hypothetical protein